MRRLGVAAVGLATAMSAQSALSADFLETVVSPIYETAGDRATLTKKAASCLIEGAGPGATAEAIKASDPERGVVVAPASFGYSHTGTPWSVRSTLTVEAKDGRVRLTHSEMQQKKGRPGVAQVMAFASGKAPAEQDWAGIPRGRFQADEKVVAAANAHSEKVALCIKGPASEAW